MSCLFKASTLSTKLPQQQLTFSWTSSVLLTSLAPSLWDSPVLSSSISVYMLVYIGLFSSSIYRYPYIITLRTVLLRVLEPTR